VTLLAHSILRICVISVPAPMPMEALTASSSATAWLSQSRTWLKCELALGKQPQQRTDEDMDDIVKFTRKLDFFKNMPEMSREELCRTMLLVSQVYTHTHTHTHTHAHTYHIYIPHYVCEQ
jgi:hypothetical protein